MWYFHECALMVIPNVQAGFFLVQYAQFWQEHLDKLVDLYSSGKLKVDIDIFFTFVNAYFI